MKLGVLCYIYSRHHTLLMHRVGRDDDPMHGYWIGLGGKVDIAKGETPYDAVIREVKEESGFTIKPIFRGIVVFHHINSAIDTWYGYLFSALYHKVSLPETREGKLVWVDQNSIYKLKLLPGDVKLLKHLEAHRKPFLARFENDTKKLVSYRFQPL